MVDYCHLCELTPTKQKGKTSSEHISAMFMLVKQLNNVSVVTVQVGNVIYSVEPI